MERTTFNIVQEVQKAETTISVDAKQSTDFSFSICEKVIVTTGILEKHFVVRMYLDVNEKCKILYCNESDCIDGGEMFIDGLKVNEYDFQNHLKSVGLIEYQKMFIIDNDDWDVEGTATKLIKSNKYAKEMFIDRGFVFYDDLKPEEKNNVQAGRHWNDSGEKAEA